MRSKRSLRNLRTSFYRATERLLAPSSAAPGGLDFECPGARLSVWTSTGIANIASRSRIRLRKFNGETTSFSRLAGRCTRWSRSNSASNGSDLSALQKISRRSSNGPELFLHRTWPARIGVSLETGDALPRTEVERLLSQAYSLVFAKLPKKARAGLLSRKSQKGIKRVLTAATIRRGVAKVHRATPPAKQHSSCKKPKTGQRVKVPYS